MKNIIVAMLIVVLSAVTVSAASVGSGSLEEDKVYSLEEMLQYAYEDEIMAKYEYEQLIESFDVTNPFVNIIKAETRHISSVENLYSSYGLEIPEFDPSAYVVIPETEEEIYAIGVEAEIKNIAMYDVFLEQDLADDVRNVFLALQKGSEQHLAAFEKEGLCDEEATGSGNQGNGRTSGQGMNQSNRSTTNGSNQEKSLNGQGRNVNNRGNGNGNKGR